MPFTIKELEELEKAYAVSDDTIQINSAFPRIAEELRRAWSLEQKSIDWCAQQMEGWNKASQRLDYKGNREYDHTCFPSGVHSGYAWMKDHIPHLFSGEDCKCPR